jgi:hypothetical protein
VPKGPGSAGRLQFPQQSSLVEVVDERALAIDLQHGQPFAIPRLELGIARDVDELVLDTEARELLLRAVAETAVPRSEEDDARYG